MKLEQQVVSLDLSKRLKELGFKQESFLTWNKSIVKKTGEEIWTLAPCFGFSNNNFPSGRTHNHIWDEECSAYTVAELGQILYEALEKIGWKYFYDAYSFVWGFTEGTKFVGEIGVVDLMRNPNFAAKMLIYLKGNNTPDSPLSKLRLARRRYENGDIKSEVSCRKN